MIQDFVFGLVAPSGPVRDINHLDLALKRMNELGWRYKEGITVRNRQGFLSADDDTRLQDLLNMYLDEEVTHIWCVRGGYGTSRIIERFSQAIGSIWPLKPIIGFSDITVLHSALFSHPIASSRPGCKGYHAPMVLSLLGREVVDELSIQSFVSRLEERAADLALGAPKALVFGRAQGALVGGNLTVCAALCGTKYSLSSQRCKEPLILFLEDIGEPPYRIDRCLVQLQQSGLFGKLSGVILGDFDSGPIDTAEIQDVLGSHFTSLSIPVIAYASIGHGVSNVTLPYGHRVDLQVFSEEIRCRLI